MIEHGDIVADPAGQAPGRVRIRSGGSRATTARRAAVIALSAAACLAVAPRTIGGAVSYVITDGVSMQPMLHTGDVVVLRTTREYGAGDVVAYHSEQLNRTVLHRIVRLDDTRAVMKGDANHWLDRDRPRVSELLGRSWIVIPGVGRILGWIREPWIVALLAASIGYLAWGKDPRGEERDVDARGEG